MTLFQAPDYALQQAIYSRLSQDSDLITALGGGKIYDEVPQNHKFPYVAFGPIDTFDFDASEANCFEHLLRLHIWTRRGGRGFAAHIANLIRQKLHDQPLTLSGYQLVNLRFEQARSERVRAERLYKAELLFRAVTSV